MMDVLVFLSFENGGAFTFGKEGVLWAPSESIGIPSEPM